MDKRLICVCILYIHYLSFVKIDKNSKTEILMKDSYIKNNIFLFLDPHGPPGTVKCNCEWLERKADMLTQKKLHKSD